MPALRTARTITSVHTPIVRGTSPIGIAHRDVVLGLRGVRVGVDHGLLRADQDVERIGDAVVVAIVRGGAGRERALDEQRSRARRDRRRRSASVCAPTSRVAVAASGYALRGKPSIESTSTPCVSSIRARHAIARRASAGSAIWTFGSRSAEDALVGEAEADLGAGRRGIAAGRVAGMIGSPGLGARPRSACCNPARSRAQTTEFRNRTRRAVS